MKRAKIESASTNVSRVYKPIIDESIFTPRDVSAFNQLFFIDI